MTLRIFSGEGAEATDPKRTEEEEQHQKAHGQLEELMEQIKDFFVGQGVPLLAFKSKYGWPNTHQLVDANAFEVRTLDGDIAFLVTHAYWTLDVMMLFNRKPDKAKLMVFKAMAETVFTGGWQQATIKPWEWHGRENEIYSQVHITTWDPAKTKVNVVEVIHGYYARGCKIWEQSTAIRAELRALDVQMESKRRDLHGLISRC